MEQKHLKILNKKFKLFPQLSIPSFHLTFVEIISTVIDSVISSYLCITTKLMAAKNVSVAAVIFVENVTSFKKS